MRRHLVIALRQAKLCLARDMQYRLHFVGRTASWLLWTGVYLAFIEIVLSKVGAVGGWGRTQMHLLYGTYMLMDGLAQMCIQPNMHQMANHVRKGTLDLILVKPMDSQFMASTGRWDWGGLGSLIVGGAVVFLASDALGRTSAAALAGYVATLAAATATLYSLWFTSVLIVFAAQRADSIGHLFVPFFQMCRYPIGAYPPVIGAVLRTVLPMAYVVTVPAQTLMGVGSLRQFAVCAAVAAAAFAVSRVAWRFALSVYTSASS